MLTDAITPGVAKRTPILRGAEDHMDRFDPKIALEELTEEAALPHPVRMRDMILRIKLALDQATEINREFQSYLSHYGETQRIAREILEKLAAGTPKNP
jgi:hypothetical protein